MPAAFTTVLMLSACSTAHTAPARRQGGSRRHRATAEVFQQRQQRPHSDLQPIIAQDEGSIDAGKLRGRHPEGYLSSKEHQQVRTRFAKGGRAEGGRRAKHTRLTAAARVEGEGLGAGAKRAREGSRTLFDLSIVRLCMLAGAGKHHSDKPGSEVLQDAATHCAGLSPGPSPCLNLPSTCPTPARRHWVVLITRQQQQNAGHPALHQ